MRRPKTATVRSLPLGLPLGLLLRLLLGPLGPLACEHRDGELITQVVKRLGFGVRAPDLNSLGFALVGGRLVAGNEMPTAMFVYENADKQRMTLQVRKHTRTGETAFRYAVEDGVGVYYWIEDNCSYALSGNLDRQQLLAVGRVVYGQLAALEATSKK